MSDDNLVLLANANRININLVFDSLKIACFENEMLDAYHWDF